MSTKYAIGQRVTIPWGRNGEATSAVISAVRSGKSYRSALGAVVEYFATPDGEPIGKWIPTRYVAA